MVTPDLHIFVCYPPPGFDLPVKRCAAVDANRARVKLGKWVRREMPEWSHAVASYVIRAEGEPAP